MAQTSSNLRLLLGGDSHQRKTAVDEIQRRRYGDGDVERMAFDASAGDSARAIEEVLSYSLFSPDRIVILERVDGVPKKDIDTLAEYAKNPRGDTPFILFSESEKDTSKVLLKAIDKKLIRTLPKTSRGQIQKMVQDQCAARNIQFEREAMNFYLQICGDNVDAALRELDKLLMWADDNGKITVDTCKRLVQTEEEKNIWAITNAVGDKDVNQALQALQLLLTQGDDEVSITGRLIASFRGMYWCRVAAQDKIPESEWAKRTGQNPYSLRQAKQRSQRFSIQGLRRAIAFLRRMDNDLKGGRSTPSAAHKQILLERLIIDLCRMG